MVLTLVCIQVLVLALIVESASMGWLMYIETYTGWRCMNKKDFSHLQATFNFFSILTLIRKDYTNPRVDYAFASLYKQLGSPGAFIVDLRPFMYVICVIFSHSVAEQLSRSSKLFRYSVPKSPTMHELDPAIGKTSILGVEVRFIWSSLFDS
jgi:hypothetical protein